jgi:hypothetical protein
MPDLSAEAEGLVRAADSFIRVLEQETDAVRAMDTARAEALAPRKAELSGIYEAHARVLHQNAADLRKLDADLRRRMVQAQERLTGAITHNLSALDAAREATQRVIKMIVSAVQRGARQTGTYGPRQSRAMPALAGMGVDKVL